MVIVSVSLPQELLDNVDKLSRRRGFASRSDLIRHALRSHISETPDLYDRQGSFLATVTVISERQRSKDIVGAVQHAFESIVTAQLHAHLDEKNCLEVLAVRGPSAEVRGLIEKVRAVRGVKQVRLTVVSTM